ncbi:MAG: DEAD/DEAH box helicase family protein [Candidatus Aenigmarchaeota archaeon]|nr:DEAD/DEAH box helicase family protein [Candidatus Aenigmarchaeota archaeon]
MAIKLIEIGKERTDYNEDFRSFFPFGEMRQHQQETIAAILKSFREGQRCVMLEAPTGFGKSAVAMAVANYFNSAYFLVSSKFLQEQYLRDFPIPMVKGRGNFPCLLDRQKSVDIGDCVMKKGFECPHLPVPEGQAAEEMVPVARSDKRGKLYISPEKEMCLYWKQKCDAMNRKVVVFNYDYFLNETNFVGDFGPRKLIICDEAHNIEGRLMDYISFRLSAYDAGLIGQSFPKVNMEIKEWLGMLKEWKELFEEKIKKEEGKTGDMSAKELERLRDMRNKKKKLGFLIEELEADEKNWVTDFRLWTSLLEKGLSQKGWVEFKPIEVKKWSNLLFDKADHFLLQSATILDAEAMAHSLNISGDIAYIRVPSTFPLQRRPFIFSPVGSMAKRNAEGSMPRLLKSIKSILDKHPKEKGVIHTHSYTLQSSIMTSIDSGRLLSNDSKNREHIFRKFMGSVQPLVLVTPSAYEGVDLKYDFCRFQVMCKVPYPDLGNPQIRARMERDPRWYAWLTAVRLIQTYGRGMRAEDDSCVTYMLDADFLNFAKRNHELFPEWFKESVKRVGHDI